MGGEQHAEAPVALGGDEVPDDDAALGVDAGGGLVEEEDLRPAHQGQGQGQALLLTARQPPPRGPAGVGQSDLVEQVVRVLGVVVVGGEQLETWAGPSIG